MKKIPLNIAIAQINVTVGDIDGNVKKILAAHKKAAGQGAELVVFPELALVGYPPEDLVLMPEFRKAAMKALAALAKKTAKGPAMIVGALWEGNPHPNLLPEREEGRSTPSPSQGEGRGEGVYNAAILLDGGKIAHVQKKTCLPNFGVFDEKRIFSEGSGGKVITFRGHKIGILVCEDTWHKEPIAALKKQKPDLLISINASPFEAGKLAARKKIAAAAKLPILYCNLVGGQDDIVFDGGSFMLDAKGKVIAQLPQFEEVVTSGRWQVAGKEKKSSFTCQLPLGTSDSLWRAMMLGLSDYVEKNNFPGVIIGLSGGIDSALTAALAVDALGAARVRGVLLPSPYTSKESVEDALALARNLGIKTDTVSIAPGMQIFEEVMSPVFHESGWMENVAVGGNAQARLRGLALMAISNHSGFMLLTTGNKSEIAVGYTTLYGDSCGGYNVIKDLYKTQIYALANWRNARSAVIPKRSITKAPSAELAPGQKDSDQLPPYDVLDKILTLHIEGRKSAREIIAKGYKKSIVEKVLKLVRTSEYKRRQSAPGVKLFPMQFGKDRRYPLTNKF